MRVNNPLAKAPGALPGERSTIAKTQQQGEKAQFEEFLTRATEGEAAAQDGRSDAPAVREAAKQFESFFLAQIFKSMRETVPKDGLFQQGFDNEVYTEMLDQEHARQLSDSGGIGLAEVLEAQFMRGQGDF